MQAVQRLQNPLQTWLDVVNSTVIHRIFCRVSWKNSQVEANSQSLQFKDRLWRIGRFNTIGCVSVTCVEPLGLHGTQHRVGPQWFTVKGLQCDMDAVLSLPSHRQSRTSNQRAAPRGAFFCRRCLVRYQLSSVTKLQALLRVTGEMRSTVPRRTPLSNMRR